ncbi:MAG: hypothetical protein WAW60_03210 [Candidatus Saccharimonadales bacterium]
MALLKIYTLKGNKQQLFNEIAPAMKYVAAAALNVPSMPTTPANIETVYCEGIDLIDIDYIIEIIAVERPNQQHIADKFIAGLNQMYPDRLFSVYFNIISENGMASSLRKHSNDNPITMKEAIERSTK